MADWPRASCSRARLSSASRVRTPTLLIHSDGCALPDNAKSVYARLAGPKRLCWLDGTQQDYYDQNAQVSAAVEHIDAWFKEVTA